ncbi:MAG: VCBS repeat-containing protein [Deltaproteobacteria bacterium]|nr:VCBS repeat-containing protein [Deltaproteobacteria bacterium]
MSHAHLCLPFVAGVVVAVPLQAAEAPGFPVLLGRGNTVKGVTIADLDGDGRLSIVAAAGETVVALTNDGKMRPGFPMSLHDATQPVPVTLAPNPAVCDLNGDNKNEILVSGSSRKLYALSAGGAPVAGFPVTLDGMPRSSPACVPVPGTRRFDVVLTTDAGSLLLVAGAGGAPKALAKIGRGAEGGVAVADLDLDGSLELITGGGDSRLYVFDLKGQPRRGFPYKMSFRLSGVPAVGDINDDGKAEIVFGSQDFKIHAVDAAGNGLAGFPVDSGYRIYAGVALADLNDDRVLDWVVGSGDKSVYAGTGAGKALEGFPLVTPARFDADAAIADMDRDGRPEILIAGDDGVLRLLTAAGAERALEIEGRAQGAPAVGDLNGDGVLEVVVAGPEPAIHVALVQATGKAEAAIADWPMVGHDPQRSGRHAPNPARFKDLQLANIKPLTTEALVVKYTYFDLDREPERDTQIRWFKDGARQAAFDNKREIPASETEKHQRWSYSVQEGANFKAYGDSGVLSRVFKSTGVEVLNTAPQRPEIKLSPETPRTTDTLEVAVSRASSDADGDRIEYRQAWLKNDRPQRLPVTATRVEPSLTVKNEVWQVIVVPFDGEIEGAPATASVQIRNTPPADFKVALEPAAPRIDDVATVKIARAAPDADGDVVTYTYRYSIDGAPFALADTLASVPPRALRKHQRLEVEVTAHDDQEPGAKASVVATAVNTAPPAPTVVIWPPHPKTADDLVLGLAKEVADADRDAVRLKHQWAKDGLKVELPTTVASQETKKGQRWSLTVTPFDGEADGAAVTVETRIENSPPTRPDVDLPRYQFATDEPITPRIRVAAKDDDGDALTLRYLWRRDGKPAGFRDNKAGLAAADTKKGEQWEVAILATDGEVDGPLATLRFGIRNTPPAAPEIALSLERPTVTEQSEVKIVREASDKDGDTLTYRYRWYRDDVAMSAWAQSKSALAAGDARKGQHWRVEVKAFDGDEEGEAAVAELWVQNHVPAPPRLAIEPAAPRATDNLTCKRTVDGTDPDGDLLSYRSRWLVDGQPAPLAPGQDSVPAARTKKGQSWQCEMAAFDGELVAAVARSAPVTVANTPPERPVATITPASPGTEADLVCALSRPAVDADLDPLTYAFAWTVDGKRYAATAAPGAKGAAPSSVVSAAATKRGETWQCEVTVSDGSATSGPVLAKTVVRNSAPTPPRVKVTPEGPRPGQELACVIDAESKDIDGDPVHYRYVWSKDGVAQPFSPSSTNVPGRLVKLNDLWRCEVTPADNAANGAAAVSADVVVRGSP